MPESWRPSLRDIRQACIELADRAAMSPDDVLDPEVPNGIQDVAEDLELFIPGLDPAPDAEAGQAMAAAAQTALDRGDAREALVRGLRGLSFSPHDPALFYVLASATFELGMAELALRLLLHVLWIHPGHRAARADLQALTAFLEGRDEEERAA